MLPTRPPRFHRLTRAKGRLRLAGLIAGLFSMAVAAHHAHATPGAATTTTPHSASAAADTSALPPLAAGQRLAHRLVRGALGPWPQVEVWLTQPSQVPDGVFTPWVRAPGPAGPAAPAGVYTLPTPSEPGDFFQFQVRSVMFRSLDGGPEKALIVLYTAARIGPQKSPYAAACVYRWDQGEFVRDSVAEARLKGARNAAEVASRLAEHKTTP